MLQAFNDFVLSIADPLLGWMLMLPADLALFIVAAGTGAVLTFVRLFTTDQEMLGRIAADKKRLKELKREAKKRGDKDSARRHAAVFAQLGPKAMKYEGKPLLVAIPVIAVLGVWAFTRLGYRPPEPGEPVELRAHFSPIAIGSFAHVVPAEGLSAPDGWVQAIEEAKAADGAPEGVARWKIVAAGAPEPYLLEVRQGGHTHAKELLVDGRHYSPPLEVFGPEFGELAGWGGPGDELRKLELGMTEYRPFGFVPGIRWILFAPWLVGYLAIAVPVVFGLKWIFNIY